VGEVDLHDLATALRELHEHNDDEMRSRWDRSLPPADSLLDRWERARRLGFGDGASVYASAYVYGEVAVGERAWIGPNVLLDGSGGPLHIGRFCSISAGVQIYTHDTVAWSLSGGVRDRAVGAVSVGDCCHLGAGAIVAAGSHIGSRCVVGAQAFVKGEVPDATVVAGVPARPIGRVVGEGSDVRIVLDRDRGTS